jgi:hypothetical protein
MSRTPRIRSVIAVALLAAFAAAGVRAQEQARKWEALEQENAMLRSRVDKLENELVEIKKLLQARPAPRPNGTNGITPAEFSQEELANLKGLAASKKRPVVSNLNLELYGYVKLDAAHDSARSSVGNFARWVEPDVDDDQFTMTARQTRLDLKIAGPDERPVQTSGLVEVDFYGGGEENKNGVLLRHAYMNFDWPELQFSVTAGQTFDVISPLFMPTLNYTVGWWQGNIGYRRPQIRATKIFDAGEDVEVKLEAAAARTISNRVFVFAGRDSGDDSGSPSAQGRVSVTFPFFNSQRATVGFSGHWGQEEQDLNTRDGHSRYESWSANVDVSMPLTSWASLQGEAFVGEDLDTYNGGIGQGINLLSRGPISSRGGWMAGSFRAGRKWQFNLGGGIEEVSGEDLSALTPRSMNMVVFGNAQYSITPNASVGFELSRLHTEYLDFDPADDLREQLSFIYKF